MKVLIRILSRVGSAGGKSVGTLSSPKLFYGANKKVVALSVVYSPKTRIPASFLTT